ncbi:MAG: TonB family protein [Opitutaceae bacterium]
MKNANLSTGRLSRGDEEYNQGFGARAASVAFAVLVSGGILFGLSQAQRTTHGVEEPVLEDLRAVVVPPPPPPPPAPQTAAAATDNLLVPLELISGLVEAPLPDEVRVAAAFVTEIAEPTVTLKTDLVPGAFRPRSGQGGLGFETRRVYEKTEVDRAVTALNRVSPKIHPNMLRGTTARRVLLLFVVGTDGLAHEIRVLQSVSPVVDALAVEAVQDWTFRPARKDKKAVQQWVQLPIIVKDGSGSPLRLD